MKLKYIDLTDNESVAATTGTETRMLSPPKPKLDHLGNIIEPGKIWRIRGIYLNIPAPVGDTAGTHKIEFFRITPSGDRELVNISGAHSTVLKIDQGEFTGGTDETPGAAATQFEVIYCGRFVLSHRYPLKIIYTNATDAAQAGIRALEFLVEEEDDI